MWCQRSSGNYITPNIDDASVKIDKIHYMYFGKSMDISDDGQNIIIGAPVMPYSLIQKMMMGNCTSFCNSLRIFSQSFKSSTIVDESGNPILPNIVSGGTDPDNKPDKGWCSKYEPGKDKDGNNFIYGLTRYNSDKDKIWDGEMFREIYKYFCKQESKVYIYENTNLTAEISNVGTINPNPITTNSKQNYFGYQVYLSNNKFMSCVLSK